MTKDELIAFEKDIEQEFLAGHIRAPIHLSKGNEDQLIEIFRDVQPGDWVFSTHRSHYHALLKGIPKEWLRAEIMAGRSMHIFSREYKFVTSSIVNGCTPQAVGVALGIKLRGGLEKVWLFVGDMAASVGVFQECFDYARGHELPIRFVVEDNGMSTNTPTVVTWGDHSLGAYVHTYAYERGYPHINVGKFVEFK